MDVIDYIYDECHRQHVTNYGDFANGLWLAGEPYPRPTVHNFPIFVQGIAREVEPDVNRYNHRNGRFDNLRTSHVGFMHGGSAAPAGEVRERFDRWCENAYNVLTDTTLVDVEMDAIQDDLIELLIKSLLDIHPWADGNGRTASILRNWMLGTLDDPSPLPYYYGNNS